MQLDRGRWQEPEDAVFDWDHQCHPRVAPDIARLAQVAARHDIEHQVAPRVCRAVGHPGRVGGPFPVDGRQYREMVVAQLGEHAVERDAWLL
jgi:hypothetical protein